jgi:hypothetical protein
MFFSTKYNVIIKHETKKNIHYNLKLKKRLQDSQIEYKSSKIDIRKNVMMVKNDYIV